MLAFHAIITAYGFWLPNDPRGSWSTYVGSFDLYRAGGGATKVTTRRSVAHTKHDRAGRLAVKEYLKHPPVKFIGSQARAVALGMAETADTLGYSIHALSVMPTHIHAVIAATKRGPALVISHLKRGATDQLIAQDLHPFRKDARVYQSCWSARAWKVFLFDDASVCRAIRYVEQNPGKDGLPRQHWSFVRPWAG